MQLQHYEEKTLITGKKLRQLRFFSQIHTQFVIYNNLLAQLHYGYETIIVHSMIKKQTFALETTVLSSSKFFERAVKMFLQMAMNTKFNFLKFVTIASFNHHVDGENKMTHVVSCMQMAKTKRTPVYNGHFELTAVLETLYHIFNSFTSCKSGGIEYGYSSTA